MAANNHTLSSFVAYVGVNESGHCGYCKSTRREKAKIAKVDQQETEQPQSNPNEGERESDDQNADDFQEEKAENSCEEREEGDSVIFGLIAHCLRLNSFNALLDLGWSRSGRYLYKPLMERTCCPQYTIRLDVHKFRLSRTQKRVLKTMQDFLKYDSKPSEKAIVREADAGNQQRELGKKAAASDEGHRKEQPEQSKRQKSTAQDGIERLPKKKELRRRRALERMQARGVDLDQYQRDRITREESRRKTVQKYLDEYPTDAGNGSGWKHRLELRLVNQPSAELDADFDEEFELFKRYQMHVHEDDPEELSPSSFTRFLAASPLLPEKDDEQEQPNNSTQKLGSFHQQYWLDGRIIAVGVVDILPHCFSAKYFFYDPDFAFLSLGTYSALREIAFTQQLAQQRPELHYYYMGYYLFDCPKMRYKGRFRPSELLCDHCFDWVPLTECQRLIAANGGRFCTFHPGTEKAKPELSPEELANIRCLFAQRHLVTFGKLRDALEAEEDGSEFKELLEKVQNFAHFAGPAAKEMALIL